MQIIGTPYGDATVNPNGTLDYGADDPADIYDANGHVMNPNATYASGYGRVGTITVTIGQCDVCNTNQLVIAIDGSEGEYGPGNICQPCAIRLFTDLERK